MNERSENEKKKRARSRNHQLTAGFATAYSAVGRIIQVAANIANLGIQQALAGKALAVDVLGAPEAAGCNGAELCALGDGA